MLMLGICDDSLNDIQEIKNLITNFCGNDYEINITTFENGENLVNYYLDEKPAFDIIFIDIYMSGKNGIATARQLRKYDPECKIIFTTSSADHALESFEVFPFNYLIKPVSKEIFNSVLEKATKTIDKEKQKSLSIKLGTQIQIIFYKDILFIESNAKLLNMHISNNKTILFYSKLDDTEKQMKDTRFIRCHKSFLVNMDYISSVGDNFFKLVDNSQIPITQRNFPSIKKAFYDYIIDRSNLRTQS